MALPLEIFTARVASLNLPDTQERIDEVRSQVQAVRDFWIANTVEMDQVIQVGVTFSKFRKWNDPLLQNRCKENLEQIVDKYLVNGEHKDFGGLAMCIAVAECHLQVAFDMTQMRNWVHIADYCFPIIKND